LPAFSAATPFRPFEDLAMSDSTVTKVDSRYSPRGPEGQVYLASSPHIGMRLWQEEPGEAKPERQRDYETVGYVIRGRAELVVEGQTVRLEAGDSWVVPRGAAHGYRILESFTAVEATYPPSHVHGRDSGKGPR
jgi:quercetin dioxygenase-like cupin family protein